MQAGVVLAVVVDDAIEVTVGVVVEGSVVPSVVLDVVPGIVWELDVLDFFIVVVARA